MNAPKAPIACLACTIFRSELEALQESGEIDFPIRYLDSMLHMDPPELACRIDLRLEDLRDHGSKVLLVYGECHNHMDEYESESGITRTKGFNCPEILLGPEQYKALRREGAFFLLPEWTLRWREIFEKELGLTGQNAKDFMQDMHTKLLYLDTGQIPVPLEHLEDASDTLGLPFEVLRVGPEHLLAAIRESLDKDDTP